MSSWWRYATRERVAAGPLWGFVMTCVGILNAVFNLPQAWKIWSTHEVNGLSLSSAWMMLVVQAVFACHGWLHRDKFLSRSGFATSLVTISIIVGQYRFR